MHSKALEKIEKKVEGTLKNCQVKDSWPQYDSFATHVESLATEILKHKKEWLTISDVFLIYYDLVWEALRETGKSHEELNGGLWDLLGEVTAQKLKKTLVEFYDSIPRNYDIYIPIPNISIELESVAFNDFFALVVFDKAEDIPGGYSNLLGFNNNFKLKRAYFRYSISGYCSYNLENFTLKKALAYFKIAFQQGLTKDIFKTNKGKPAGLIALAVQAHYQVQKVNLVSVDKTSNTPRIVSTELPLDFSMLLYSIDINMSDKQIESEKTATLKRYFRLPSLLMENHEIETVRIKSAIEWCLDSYATENTTMSFLQTCIGLEALFGDDAESESLTKTLADRCAYLVSGDIKGRKTIREKFKKLYAIRSKLVHGSATSLGTDEKQYLNWGRMILEYSIFQEIKHLNLDKN